MDILKYVKIVDGNIELDKEGFEKEFNSEKDSKVSKEVETFKTNYQKKLDNEKLSDKEKLDNAIKELEEQKIAFEKEKLEKIAELNKKTAKSLAENKGLSERELEIQLRLINESDESLDIFKDYLAERQKSFEEFAKKTKEDLQSNQFKQEEDEEINKNGESAEQTFNGWSAEEISNQYK